MGKIVVFLILHEEYDIYRSDEPKALPNSLAPCAGRKNPASSTILGQVHGAYQTCHGAQRRGVKKKLICTRAQRATRQKQAPGLVHCTDAGGVAIHVVIAAPRRANMHLA